MSEDRIYLDGAIIQPEREVTPETLSTLEACPKCKAELLHGFGLAFGGYGPYVYCETDGCDFAAKSSAGDEG